MPIFLPRRKIFKWYLHESLKQKSHSPVLDEAEFAEHCLKRLAKAEKHGPRENKPCWFEVYIIHIPVPKRNRGWSINFFSPCSFSLRWVGQYLCRGCWSAQWHCPLNSLMRALKWVLTLQQQCRSLSRILIRRWHYAHWFNASHCFFTIHFPSSSLFHFFLFVIHTFLACLNHTVYEVG